LLFIFGGELQYSFSRGLNIFHKYKVFPLDEMTVVFVEAGCAHSVQFDMKAGGKLSWNFKSDGCDIGFGVMFEDGTDIIRNSRVDSHYYLQVGAIGCAETGQCENYNLISQFNSLIKKTGHGKHFFVVELFLLEF
jgi:hypothetical protein